MSASVISGMDAAPIFEFSEHVLDFMAFFVQLSIIVMFGFSI